MLGWLVKKKIGAFEKDFGYDAGYLREMYEVSPRAFWKFSKITEMSEVREGVSKEAWYAAKIVATLTEDCGPCAQLVVQMAERAGVSTVALRAILAGDAAKMPTDAALGFNFAKAVLRRDIEESDRLRAEIVSRWGRKAVVSLALAIATSRVYPAVKYAMGHGHSCTRILVAAENIAMRDGRSAGN
jgi:AhpD family alkylhydroperoxidase